jgi:hypothetical protein
VFQAAPASAAQRVAVLMSVPMRAAKTVGGVWGSRMLHLPLTSDD